MQLNTPIVITEQGYLLDGLDNANHNNAVGIERSVFKQLETCLFQVKEDSEFHLFMKLASFKGRRALQLRNYVGVIRTPCGTQIEILPKLNRENDGSNELTRTQLLKMLRTLRNSPFKNGGLAGVHDAKMPLLEVFVKQFLMIISQLIKRGLKSDYVTVTNNTKYLKGRLLIAQQVTKNRMNPERFCIEYEEYQVNRPANRLIKSTLLLISKLTRNSKSKRLAAEYSFIFDDVPVCDDVVLDFKRVKKDRTMNYYSEALQWCALLLNGNGPTSLAGKINTLTLLYPMERVFEDYVAHSLKKNINEYFPDADLIKMQARKENLVNNHDGKPIFNLRPDYLALKGGISVCLMDAKWKLLNSNEKKNKYGISQGDMYQLYAYGHKYFKPGDDKRLMLIYPMTPEFKRPLPVFEFENKLTLKVVPFDILNGELVLN